MIMSSSLIFGMISLWKYCVFSLSLSWIHVSKRMYTASDDDDNNDGDGDHHNHYYYYYYNDNHYL